MSDIKLYKLTSGEEIIAKVVHSNEHMMTVTDAVSIVYHQVGEGQMSAGFAPFMPYSEGDIQLNHHAITSSSSVQDKLLAEYNRIFSNIVIAPANSIV